MIEPDEKMMMEMKLEAAFASTCAKVLEMAFDLAAFKHTAEIMEGAKAVCEQRGFVPQLTIAASRHDVKNVGIHLGLYNHEQLVATIFNTGRGETVKDIQH